MHSTQTDAAPGPAAAGAGDAEPPQRLWADIVHDHGDGWAFVPDAEHAVQAAVDAVAAFGGLEFAPSAVCIALSSDDQVRLLNRTYRGKDKATNVLSFPAPDSGPAGHDGPSSLGDIVLAGETVLAEARDQGLEPAAHLKHLVVHGLLHLLGFDHENDADADKMEALEVRILASLGIADPYADPHDADAVHAQHD